MDAQDFSRETNENKVIYDTLRECYKVLIEKHLPLIIQWMDLVERTDTEQFHVINKNSLVGSQGQTERLECIAETASINETQFQSEVFTGNEVKRREQYLKRMIDLKYSMVEHKFKAEKLELRTDGPVFIPFETQESDSSDNEEFCEIEPIRDETRQFKSLETRLNEGDVTTGQVLLPEYIRDSLDSNLGSPSRTPKFTQPCTHPCTPIHTPAPTQISSNEPNSVTRPEYPVISRLLFSHNSHVELH